ncbi:tetratricopeptide repeat protein [Pararobbsia alpina]|uniref:Beta-barrel assembly-enhancing protease n=1 Tax=Pararobbsia alpina TaxID=621374 RepID=A0A6S7CUG1_9BURK|nr:tetratricopeptide repeat protein [Pararobbsia alpina]CAB3788387.1 Beta-barrel assembly-enhancing protease [Pararobbsia alpina]
MDFSFAELLTKRSMPQNSPTRALTRFSAAMLAAFTLMVSGAQAQQPSSDPDDDAVASSVVSNVTANDEKDLPDVPLTGEILFQVLAAEIALQRGEPAPAYQTYIALARSTKDPRMARRAAEIALRAQSPADALTAARLWHEYSPSSNSAAQLSASLLVLNGKLDEARPLLAAQLAAVPEEQRTSAIVSLQLLISRGPDREGGLKLLQNLLQNDMTRPETPLVIARQQLIAGDPVGARQSLEQSLKLKPDFAPAALLLAQIGPDERKEAIALMEKAVAAAPTSRDLRTTLAQLYLGDEQIDNARKQFEAMRKNDPNDLAPLLALALIDLQQKQYDQASTYLQQYAVAAEKQGTSLRVDAGQAYIYLAEIEISRKDFAAAEKWLDKVSENSPEFVTARITRAQVVAQQGDIDGARKVLAALQPLAPSPRDEAAIARADAGILFDAKRYAESRARLDGAVAEFPNDPDLLYDRAMSEEKLADWPAMEADLRKLISMQPNNPNAYNALGYSLADRNERLAEAETLVEKATALSPRDAFIMDSLGWVKYRQGDKDQAITLLRRAYQIQPNAEIGAHLGEVLWVAGHQDEARQAWSEALKLEPGNDTVLGTLKRLDVPSP